MTNEEARAYFLDSNEKIISVAKDENRYNYETQQIKDVFMRRDFEAKELAIKALEQGDILEKIRNEIESQREEVSNKHSGDSGLLNYYFGLNDGLKDARDIIDKYMAESEEKNNDI